MSTSIPVAKLISTAKSVAEMAPVKMSDVEAENYAVPAVERRLGGVGPLMTPIVKATFLRAYERRERSRRTSR